MSTLYNVGGGVVSVDGATTSLVGNKGFDAAIERTNAISIHDLDLVRGKTLNITSPYSTGTLSSNSLMHPTVIRHSAGVDGSPYLMVVTPFADADDQTENPCIYVSDDLLTWRTPDGLTNPVFPTPSGGYNSDAHIYEHTDGYTYMIWRERLDEVSNTVYGSRSRDGITWDAKTTILTAAYSGGVYAQDWASPSFYHDGSQWVMFSHNIANANAVRKMVKSGDLLVSWQAVSPSTVTPTHPNSLSWWHSDIRRLSNGRLIALALEGGAGGGQAGGVGGASSAWLWQSDDAGTTWSVRQITRGRNNYRSSLVIDGEDVSAILTWVDGTPAGDPSYTVMALHPLLPGRLERRRVQANLGAVVTYSINLEDEQNLLAHVDGFAGTAADLTTPWTQVTGSAMRRNGSGVAVATDTNTAAAVVAVGSTDHWARVKFTSYASGQAYLILKYVNSTNYLAIGVAPGDGKLVVKGIVSGSATLDEAFLLTPSLANGIVVRAVVDGLLLRVFVDGVEAWEGSIPAGLAAGASCGIYSSGSASNQFDEFAAGRL